MFQRDLKTETDLELPQEVQSGCGLHLLGMKVERQDEDGDDHRGHDLQGNLGVHRTAGGFGFFCFFSKNIQCKGIFIVKSL